MIFRRLDDDFCDPLELRGDSFLGVPGLVQAVRAGQRRRGQRPGQRPGRNPGPDAVSARLCRHFLGEDLLLPSVPTWWCGDPKALQLCSGTSIRLVIKPAFAGNRFGPIFGDSSAGKSCRPWPHRFALGPRDSWRQEQLPLSTVPVLAGERLEPRQMVMRIFLAARGRCASR